MKLLLSYDGSDFNADNLQQALTAAGGNTTINIHTAQAVNITTLLQLFETAGDTKNLTAEFNGAQLSADNIQQAMSAAGAQTSISLNTAQATPIATILEVLGIAGDTKVFSAMFNGAQLTPDNLKQAIQAEGENSSMGVNTAQAIEINTLLDLLNTAGDIKQFSADFNGAQLSADNLQQAMSAAGARTSISLNTAQTTPISTLLEVLGIAADTKIFSAMFNGAQLTPDNLKQAIQAEGENSSMGVNTAQAIEINTLLDLINTAGDTKQFSAEFNGAQLSADNLQQAMSAAGIRTSISLNTAQTTPISTVLEVLSIAGDSKVFSATFDGLHLTGDNLEQAVSAAGESTNIAVTSAQGASMSTIMDIIGTAG